MTSKPESTSPDTEPEVLSQSTEPSLVEDHSIAPLLAPEGDIPRPEKITLPSAPEVPSSAVGRWTAAYEKAKTSQAYGDATTYIMGAEFLRDLFVEDWGCGLGYFRNFIPRELYRGVDGSHSPFADVLVDLRTFRSNTPGLFMRHVLEHNPCWEEILVNAVNSFTKRMVLVLFTPWQDQTRVLTVGEFTPGVHIPDIGFAPHDIWKHFQTPDLSVEFKSVQTATQYGIEHLFLVDRT